MVFPIVFLSLCSRVDTESDRLVVSTPVFGRLLMLTASSRRAEIDRVARRMTLERRRVGNPDRIAGQLPSFSAGRRVAVVRLAASSGKGELFTGAVLVGILLLAACLRPSRRR